MTEYALAPGDYIKLEGRSHAPLKLLELDDKAGDCIVQWSDGHTGKITHWLVINVYCANCGRPYSQHADGGKCLYGPWHWKMP